MDTKHLVTFVTLAEERSYAKTARVLNYAPSTLMEHVRALEEELGVPLTERDGKQILLTESGGAFLEYAREILRLRQEACDALRGEDERKERIRIATAESIGQYSMAAFFREFAADGQWDTSIKMGNCAGFVQLLHNREVDFAYVYGMEVIQSQGLESVPLFWEPLLFITGPAHPLANRWEVFPEDLNGANFVFTYVDCCYCMALKQALVREGVNLGSQTHLGSVTLIKRYLAEHCSVALLPLAAIEEELSRGELCCLPWGGERFGVLAQVLHAKGRKATTGMEALLQGSLELARRREEQIALACGPGGPAFTGCLQQEFA